MTGAGPAAVRALVSGGRLRAAIKTGNPVLASAGQDGRAPTGVSVDLARLFGEHVGMEVDLIAYGSVRSVAEALDADAWDIAFMAADPERAMRIAFSVPYVEIEASYVVRVEAPFRTCPDLDRPGLQIAAAGKAAYDLHLRRTLRRNRTGTLIGPH